MYYRTLFSILSFTFWNYSEWHYPNLLWGRIPIFSITGSPKISKCMVFPYLSSSQKTVSHLDFLRILGWIKSIQNAGKGTILHNDFGNFPGDTQNPIWSSWEPKFNLHNWAAFDPQKITDYLLFTYSFLYSSEEWSMKQCNGTSLYHGFILEIMCYSSPKSTGFHKLNK